MAPTTTLVSARVDHDVVTWTDAFAALGGTVHSLLPEEPLPPSDVCVVHDPTRIAQELGAIDGTSGIDQLTAIVDRATRAASSTLIRWRDIVARDLIDLRASPWSKVHHVTTTLHARREIESLGASAQVLPQAFDLDPESGNRHATREALGFADDAIVLLQPTRVDERKNAAGAIRFVNEVARFIRNRPVHLWIRGPVADNHRNRFDKLVARADVPVLVAEIERPADAYAACDAVVFPASWDAFGDVVLEGVAHRRPVVSASFPVLAELVAGGIRVLPIDDATELVKFLARGESARRAHLDATARRARVSYSVEDLPERIAALLDGARR